MEPIPTSPEDWLSIVQDTVQDTGRADEVIVSLESTMTGWRVSINPVRTAPTGTGPESQ